MSIATIRRAFQEGAGETIACVAAQMIYAGAGKGHTLRFRVQGKKEMEWLEYVCGAGCKPEDVARAFGEKCAADRLKDAKK